MEIKFKILQRVKNFFRPHFKASTTFFGLILFINFLPSPVPSDKSESIIYWDRREKFSIAPFEKSTQTDDGIFSFADKKIFSYTQNNSNIDIADVSGRTTHNIHSGFQHKSFSLGLGYLWCKSRRVGAAAEWMDVRRTILIKSNLFVLHWKQNVVQRLLLRFCSRK